MEYDCEADETQPYQLEQMWRDYLAKIQISKCSGKLLYEVTEKL